MSSFQPYIDPSIDPHVRTLLNLVFRKLDNHYQAITKLKPGTTVTNETVVNEGGTGGGGGGGGTVVGGVNNQTGQTAYTTQPSDNGVILVLDDASPVAVTLSTGVAAPWFLFAANLGAGTATFTPSSGTINGVGSLALLDGYSCVIFFDGTNFWALTTPIVPVSAGPVAHEWLASYDSTTGAFTLTRPDYSDLTGLPVLPANTPAVSHQFIVSYNSTTGAFALAQPAFTDISGTLAAGQLPANVPVVSFGTGAPVGSSTEGYIYFDTTGTPYHGYVFHSGSWQVFS